MRHALFAVIVAFYFVIIAQNWAVYTAAILIHLWTRSIGRLQYVPFTIGGSQGRPPGRRVAGQWLDAETRHSRS